MDWIRVKKGCEKHLCRVGVKGERAWEHVNNHESANSIKTWVTVYTWLCCTLSEGCEW